MTSQSDLDKQSLASSIGGWPPIAIAGGCGLLAGVLAKVADESGIGWLSDLGTFFAVWVLVLVMIGWRAPTIAAAAVRATLFFVGLSLGYYAYSTFVLGFPGGQLVRRWAALSVTGVPVVASAVWWASRRRGLSAAAILALVGAVALFDGNTLSYWYSLTSEPPPGVPLRPVQAAIEAITALVAVAVVANGWRTRLMGLALLFPATWIVPELMATAFRLSSP